MSGPLHGTLVVEFADYVTGPYCGALLADLGARVVKIEAPGAATLSAAGARPATAPPSAR